MIFSEESVDVVKEEPDRPSGMTRQEVWKKEIDIQYEPENTPLQKKWIKRSNFLNHTQYEFEYTGFEEIERLKNEGYQFVFEIEHPAKVETTEIPGFLEEQLGLKIFPLVDKREVKGIQGWFLNKFDKAELSKVRKGKKNETGMERSKSYYQALEQFIQVIEQGGSVLFSPDGKLKTDIETTITDQRFAYDLAHEVKAQVLDNVTADENKPPQKIAFVTIEVDGLLTSDLSHYKTGNPSPDMNLAIVKNIPKAVLRAMGVIKKHKVSCNFYVLTDEEHIPLLEGEPNKHNRLKYNKLINQKLNQSPDYTENPQS